MLRKFLKESPICFKQICKAFDFLSHGKCPIHIITLVGTTLKFYRYNNFMINLFGAIHYFCKALTIIFSFLLNRSLKFYICLNILFSVTGQRYQFLNYWFLWSTLLRYISILNSTVYTFRMQVPYNFTQDILRLGIYVFWAKNHIYTNGLIA